MNIKTASAARITETIIEEVEGVVRSHTDGIFSLSVLVEERNDVAVVDARDECFLLIVVVVHAYQSVDGDVVGRLITELDFGVDVVLAVLSTECVHDGKRVRHHEVLVLDSSIPIAGVGVDEVSIHVALPRGKERGMAIGIE